MLRTTLMIAALLTLSACATVESESYSTIVLDGRSYDLRTRTLNGPDGPYVQNAVRSRDGSYRSCNPQSPGSCKAALSKPRGGGGGGD